MSNEQGNWAYPYESKEDLDHLKDVLREDREAREGEYKPQLVPDEELWLREPGGEAGDEEVWLEEMDEGDR